MKSVFCFGILFFSLISFSGCQKKLNDEKVSINDYLKDLNNEKLGLIKIKHTNGFIIKVKNLTPEYLAYQERSMNSSLNDKSDSLIESSKKSLTFLMSIEPDHESVEGDINYFDVHNVNEFKERIDELNFGIEVRIKLLVDDNSYSPVLNSFESEGGLSKSKNFIFVFIPKESSDKSFYNSNSIDFQFEDYIFNTGINHFVFSREDLLKFYNLKID